MMTHTKDGQLTKGWWKVMLVVDKLINELPYPPSTTEIAEELGCYHSHVIRVLHILRNRGIVDFNARQPRTLRITDKNWRRFEETLRYDTRREFNPSTEVRRG